MRSRFQESVVLLRNIGTNTHTPSSSPPAPQEDARCENPTEPAQRADDDSVAKSETGWSLGTLMHELKLKYTVINIGFGRAKETQKPTSFKKFLSNIVRTALCL